MSMSNTYLLMMVNEREEGYAYESTAADLCECWSDLKVERKSGAVRHGGPLLMAPADLGVR